MGRWCSRKPLAMASRVMSLIDPNPGSSLLRIQKLMRKTSEGSKKIDGLYKQQVQKHVDLSVRHTRPPALMRVCRQRLLHLLFGC